MVAGTPDSGSALVSCSLPENMPRRLAVSRRVVQVRMSSNELAPLSVRRERERFARKRIREVRHNSCQPYVGSARDKAGVVVLMCPGMALCVAQATRMVYDVACYLISR